MSVSKSTGRIIAGAAAAALACGLATIGSVSAQADVGSAPRDLSTREINAQIAQLAAEGVSKVDVVDAMTGEVERTVDVKSSRIGLVGPGCSASSVCFPGSPPYGYQGAGSLNLNITGRASYKSGNWTSQVKYTVVGAEWAGPITAPKQGKGGGVVFGQYVNIKHLQIW